MNFYILKIISLETLEKTCENFMQTKFFIKNGSHYLYAKNKY